MVGGVIYCPKSRKKIVERKTVVVAKTEEGTESSRRILLSPRRN